MDRPAKRKPKPVAPADRFVCLCNGVKVSEIEAAIDRGCNTLSKIFDATTAGVGQCGGSCQPLLRQMLERRRNSG